MDKPCSNCYGAGKMLVAFLGEVIGQTRCYLCGGRGRIGKDFPFLTWEMTGYAMMLEPTEAMGTYPMIANG